jgi:hypothetical protein
MKDQMPQAAFVKALKKKRPGQKVKTNLLSQPLLSHHKSFPVAHLFLTKWQQS